MNTKTSTRRHVLVDVLALLVIICTIPTITSFVLQDMGFDVTYLGTLIVEIAIVAIVILIVLSRKWIRARAKENALVDRLVAEFLQEDAAGRNPSIDTYSQDLPNERAVQRFRAAATAGQLFRRVIS